MAEIEETLAEGPGNDLAQARKDSGFTQEEVAERLHLSPAIVRQLEADDYNDQIPDAFARGYLRNYAKLVELDQQVIIAKYSQYIGSTMVKNYYEPSTEIGSPQQGMQTMNQIMVWIVLAIIVVIVAVWFMGRDNSPDIDASSVALPELQNTITTPQQVADEPVVINSPDASETMAEQTDTLAVTSEASEEILETEVSPIPTGFVDTAEAMLTFEFLGDCWVQVTDANGEVLAVGTKTAGRRFQVSGMAPIDVVLGKPREVYIAYNEEEVDLSCFPAGSTARFSLDQAQVCDL